jgi:hypothetical protein
MENVGGSRITFGRAVDFSPREARSVTAASLIWRAHLVVV